MIEQDEVTISTGLYQALLTSELKLKCLERAGVDNWEGYDMAMDEYTSEVEGKGICDFTWLLGDDGEVYYENN